jgi:hypothetical protein
MRKDERLLYPAFRSIVSGPGGSQFWVVDRRNAHGCWNRRRLSEFPLARMDTEPVRAALRSSEQW